jgi:hypothetical protein
MTAFSLLLVVSGVVWLFLIAPFEKDMPTSVFDGIRQQ